MTWPELSFATLSLRFVLLLLVRLVRRLTMFRQAELDSLAMTLTHQRAATYPAGAAVWLGPPQRMKLALQLPFIRRGPPVILPQAPQPLWSEKGWRRVSDTNEYTGDYAAAGRRWRGLIREPYPGGYTAYIWHPPLAEIGRNTGHRPCFRPNGEAGQFQIYFHLAPSSLDHAITSIEAVLAQAYNGRS